MSDQPDWKEVLRTACDASSQAAVAAQIGYSSGAVCSVLAGSYRGNLARVRQAVEGALMAAVVECPVIGELPRQRCIEHQRTPFTPTNPARVALYRACRGGCVHALVSAKASSSKESDS